MEVHVVRERVGRRKGGGREWVGGRGEDSLLTREI